MATYYWRGGSGTWDSASSTNWALSPGGPGGFGPPTSSDTVFFNSSSSFTGPYTVTVASTAVCLSATIENIGGAVPTLSLSGNAALCSSNGTLTFHGGTLALNNYTLSVGAFVSNSSVYNRSITFGSGSIVLLGNATTVWQCQVLNGFSFTGTPTVSATYAGSVGTRTFNHGTVSGLSASNAVALSISAGSDTVVVSGGLRSLDFTGFSGTRSNTALTLYGSLTVSSGMTLSSGANTLTFAATSGTQDITSSAKMFDFPLTINGVGGTVRLLDDLTVGSTRTTSLFAGTFNANNYNFSTGLFTVNSGSPRTVTMGSGTWTLTGTGNVWDFSSTSGLTFNKDTANIVLSSTSSLSRGFFGGSLTYNNLTIGGATGTSTLSITGNNTFNTISSTKTVAHTVRFSGGSTTTVANWTVTGTAGNVVTLTSDTTSQFNLVKTGGGTVSLSYANISYSNATPGSTWYAYLSDGNVDGGNNTGWTFTSGFLTLFL